MFAVTFLTSNSKYRCSLTLQSQTSCWRHCRNMVAALWPWGKPWLLLRCLGSPLEGLAGAPPASPLALRSVPARRWLRSEVQWHGESRSSRCIPLRQTLQASPLSPHSHCFPTMLLKQEGFVHRCYFKLCVSSLLEAPFTPTLGEGAFSLNQMQGVEGEVKGLCFLLSVPDFPVEPIVLKLWG